MSSPDNNTDDVSAGKPNSNVDNNTYLDSLPSSTRMGSFPIVDWTVGAKKLHKEISFRLRRHDQRACCLLLPKFVKRPISVEIVPPKLLDASESSSGKIISKVSKRQCCLS